MIEPARPRSARGARRLSDLTWVALILSGLGLALAFMSGAGLPIAAAGTVCGLFALRRRPDDSPWPYVAVAAGSVGSVLALILAIVTAVEWLPVLPGMLLG
ncbi:hypothetical protein [Agrococcus sp. TF02-05]|uniref:hypothetical protein n=1 Tax=Agrococcus sp. TF02-05 TaxID=2815211 RepID=UPI001AA15196|nr:hypothetical protein [Agrococcus sp. TF02-05]MBO1769688.1 hypothetical protein [Agrococcus sp. TF02-05]